MVQASQNELKVLRTNVFIPKMKYYNHIDMGIFLCFLDLCLSHEKITFSRELYQDEYLYKVGENNAYK